MTLPPAPDAGPDDLRAAPEGPAGGRPTVLAVIDMQRVFGDDGSPWQAPRFAEVVGPVRRLVEAHRAAGHPVVFTQFVAPQQPAGSWVPYYEAWPFALRPSGDELWDVVPELADLADDADRAPDGSTGLWGTVIATTFSKWAGLAPHLPRGGRLVLCGVSTDCCVLSTALAAADDGIEVVVVASACAGVDDEHHAKALDIMRLYAPLVTVVDHDPLVPG